MRCNCEGLVWGSAQFTCVRGQRAHTLVDRYFGAHLQHTTLLSVHVCIVPSHTDSGSVLYLLRPLKYGRNDAAPTLGLALNWLGSIHLFPCGIQTPQGNPSSRWVPLSSSPSLRGQQPFQHPANITWNRTSWSTHWIPRLQIAGLSYYTWEWFIKLQKIARTQAPFGIFWTSILFSHDKLVIYEAI